MDQETGKERVSTAESRGEETAAPPQEAGEPLRGRMDQVGSIVSTGLDLIEAAVTLGVTVATRLGSMVQEQGIDRIQGSAPPPGEPPPPYAEPGVGSPPYHPQGPDPGGGTEAPPGLSYVVNRTPLTPGSPVRVSFTISNDSPSSPKRVVLGVEGFAGEVGGATLDGRAFAIEPDDRLIEPLDFDKFTLVGTIPPNAPTGTYSGWILVTGEEEMRIPVRLVVAGGV